MAAIIHLLENRVLFVKDVLYRYKRTRPNNNPVFIKIENDKYNYVVLKLHRNGC